LLYNFSLNPSQHVHCRLSIEDLTHSTWIFISQFTGATWGVEHALQIFFLHIIIIIIISSSSSSSISSSGGSSSY